MCLPATYGLAKYAVRVTACSDLYVLWPTVVRTHTLDSNVIDQEEYPISSEYLRGNSLAHGYYMPLVLSSTPLLHCVNNLVGHVS